MKGKTELNTKFLDQVIEYIICHAGTCQNKDLKKRTAFKGKLVMITIARKSTYSVTVIRIGEAQTSKCFT